MSNDQEDREYGLLFQAASVIVFGEDGDGDGVCVCVCVCVSRRRFTMCVCVRGAGGGNRRSLVAMQYPFSSQRRRHSRPPPASRYVLPSIR